MLIPFVETFPSPKPPHEIFAPLAAQEFAFFLDSVEYHSQGQRYSYLGANPFLTLTLEKEKIYLRGEKEKTFPASHLTKLLRNLLQQYRIKDSKQYPFFLGGAVGYWSYEMASFFEKIKFRRKPLPDYPLLSLAFYRDILVYDHLKKIYHQVRLVSGNGKNVPPTFFQGQGEGNGKEKFHLQQFAPEISKHQFEKMVRRAKDYIAAGDIYQANLSQRFQFKFSGDPFSLYRKLREINPSPFSSFLKFGDLSIVSSSPERLVLKQGRLCETRPIAGTRPRRTPSKTTAQLEKELLGNEKERAEHIMLVDLERNDLGRVCDFRSVRVAEMMKVEKYSHVMHIVSKITGRLSKGKDALDLIRAVFPGGTITGCPKVRCMEIIEELEPVRRGIYTGSIGYLDFRGDMDLNIVIRTLVLQKNKGTLQVGAGIVHDSDPAKEYEETLHKGEALAEALVKASL